MYAHALRHSKLETTADTKFRKEERELHKAIIRSISRELSATYKTGGVTESEQIFVIHLFVFRF